ncbi:MAG: heme-dependent oxidative N-demethylase family protein [bacterium]
MAFNRPSYTPYDGATQPFTIGLQPIPPAEWLKIDHHLTEHLSIKQKLLQTAKDKVIAEDASVQATGAELLTLLVENLSRYHGATHKVCRDAIEILPAQRTVPLDLDHPFAILAQLVQEDFCLIRQQEGKHYFVAAALCFPSSWALADKIGRPLEAVHAPVPGYEGQMSSRVNLMFSRLPPDRIIWRMNWSLDEGPDLYRPVPHDHEKWLVAGADPLEQVFIRVERQTIRRLPQSGDIVFSIRIFTDALKLITRPENKDLLHGLIEQLSNLTPEQNNYKGLGRARDPLLQRLRQML